MLELQTLARKKRHTSLNQEDGKSWRLVSTGSNAAEGSTLDSTATSKRQLQKWGRGEQKSCKPLSSSLRHSVQAKYFQSILKALLSEALPWSRCYHYLAFWTDKIVQKTVHKAYRRNFLMFSAFISATSFCLTFWWTSEELGLFSVSFVNHPETRLKSFLLSKNVLTCLSAGATCGTKQSKPQGWTELRAPSVRVCRLREVKQRSKIYFIDWNA